jgi:two-component system, chemotaxis family, CheB/CheR fusion protein
MTKPSSPPLVALGAAAGATQALRRFFEAMPDEPNAAFVVVVKQEAASDADLVTALAESTKLPVTPVVGETHLSDNHIYVVAPNQDVRLTDNTIGAIAPKEQLSKGAPVDFFFRSLASQRNDGLAIVLTGGGVDGAIGARAIKEAGGIVLVQDPAEAEYPSMPRNAIAMDVADFVKPVGELAAKVFELVGQFPNREIEPFGESDEETLQRILAHVRVRLGHDFSAYKRATIVRRIARRSHLMHQNSLAGYYAFLRENPEEAQALFSDFLISVTTFFRDVAPFEALAKHVIPLLFDEQKHGGSIRVWVPGCATGEEAYSIGILLLEEANRRDFRPEIQVFGSDLDAGALAVAREGRYPASIEADVSEERLRCFFQREGEHYRVSRELREVVLLANHSLLRDPPFSRLNMISCRNLLIYLNRELQQQVCNTFHYALNAGGFLFVGASESADQPNSTFRLVDREAKIYRSVPASGERMPTLPILLGPRRKRERESLVARHVPRVDQANGAALHRQMLEKISPPSMLVDSAHRAVHLSENAGRFLQMSGGPVTSDATDMVRPELRFDLRTALNRAFERGEPSLSMPIFVKFNDSARRIYLQVRPVEDGDAARHALVFFIEGEEVDADAAQATGELASGEPAVETIKRLQEELQLSQGRLYATRADSEAATEESRAANEELQSINEEYRSTAEELETSKEELQSINEELQTVNNELKLKLESISRAHSDLQNLMAATDVGTLFLDTALRIKRFTPHFAQIFNVTGSDEGRPITDFTHQLEYDGLAGDANRVLRDLAPFEYEVKSRSGGWYLIRIRPYRTIEDKIDGVVITFVDITERRRVEEALRESERRLKQEMRLVEMSRMPIFVWDFDDGIVQWNRGSEELYGYSRSEAIGKRIEELRETTVIRDTWENVRETLLRTGSWSGELIQKLKDGRSLVVESQLELKHVENRRLVLESTRDITEQKKWEARRQLLLDELRHRVANTLSVVQSMARQTQRTTHSTEEFVRVFDGRLTSLSIAHNLLLATHWEGAELGALARGQLAAHLQSADHRLRIQGEPVQLPPELATPFALVLHELATNAAKYGALSSEKGFVSLSWSTHKNNDVRYLEIEWRETDGPAVGKPTRRGFGGQLIERSLPGAKVQRMFDENGVVCRIEVQWQEARDERTG